MRPRALAQTHPAALALLIGGSWLVIVGALLLLRGLAGLL